jgi:two-component system sensor kinase FixL
MTEENITYVSDKRLFAIVGALGSPAMLLSGDGAIVYANSAFCDLYGYALEELVGQHFLLLSAEPKNSMSAFEQRKSAVSLRIHRHKMGMSLKLELYLNFPAEGEDGLVFVAVRSVGDRASDDEELRWRHSVESSGDGIWDWNVRTRRSFRSESWYRMLGFEMQEVIAEKNFWSSRLHLEDRDRVFKAVDDCLTGRSELYAADYRLRCRDGQWKWIAARGRVVERENGLPVRVLGTHRDIDALRQSQSDWKLAQQMFSAVLEQSPDAIAIANCETNNTYLEVNAAYCDMVGYTRGELICGQVNDFQFWDNKLQARAAHELLTKGIPINDLYCSFKNRDGQRVVTSLSARKIIIDGVSWLIIVRRDISSRLADEARLRESEERWRFAIEGHGDALWDWNVEKGTVYRSARWLTILKLPPTAFNVDMAVHGEVFDTEDLPNISIGIRDLLTGKLEELSQICRLRCGDGERIWVSYRCRVMARSPQGRALRVIGTMRDISTQRERQKSIDAQLAQLSHSGRLLILGEMASTIAHEINQPLAVISSYAGVLVRKTAEYPELQVFAARVEEQALRAGNIVWRMREFSRNKDLALAPVDVDALIKESLEWIQLDSQVSGIQFSAAIPDGIPPIMADRIQIQQVLLNVLRNAVQSMAGSGNSGRAERSVAVRVREDTGRGEVVIEVADRGCGLPSQVAFDVFKPFFTTKAEGLGLGLSISQSIVTRHGGRLWSSARTNGGTVFSFSVPQQKIGGEASPEHPAITDAAKRRGEYQ